MVIDTYLSIIFNFNKGFKTMKQIETNDGDIVNEIALRHVGVGDILKRKPNAKTVFVVNHYDRASKTWSLSDWHDMNREIFLKSDTLVYIGFEF